MTNAEFIILVARMRAKQKEYFATRHSGRQSSEVLLESKKLEREVDAAIKDLRDGQRTLPME